MNKPNNYENTQAGGDYTPIIVGGHTAVIKKVEEATSQNGKPMIKVAIDFDEKDVQPGYFTNAFKNDTREEKKWPYQGVVYILSEDQDGNCSRSFKSFITAVETSNEGFKVSWGKTFAAQFTGKKVGCIYGEVEEEYNGEIKTRIRHRFFCNYDKAPGADIPAKREIVSKPSAPVATRPDGFVNVENDGTIPF